MPLCPTARTPPTVAPSHAGSATHCPCSASAASSSVTSVPAPQHTVISSAAISAMPAGARTSRDRRVGRPADVPLRAAALDRDRTRRRRPPRRTRRGRSSPRSTRHTHAPSGTACRSPQREPGGQHLLRVRRAVGIEGLAQAGLRVEIVGREQHRHEVALLDADAVLAREHAAGGDRRLHDLLARGVARAPSFPGTRRSNDSSGCRLPSPAWNTFITMRS